MKKIVSILILSLFTSSFQVLAFIKPIRRHSKSKVYLNKMGSKIIRPELYQAKNSLDLKGVESVYSVQRDTLDNSVRVVTGDLGFLDRHSKSSKLYKSFSLKFLKNNFKIFKLKSEDLKLVDAASYIGKDVQFIQFEVVKEGISLEDSYISFRFKRNKLVQVANFTFPEAEKKLDSVLDQQELIARINKELPNKKLVEKGEIFRIKEGSKGYEIVKIREFSLVSPDDVGLDLQVEQTTGEIFELKEDKFYYQGHAHHTIYPRWYREDLVQEPLVHAKIKSAPSFPNIVTDGNGGFLADKSITKMTMDGFHGKQVFIRNKTGVNVKYEAELHDGSWVLNGKEEENSAKPWINKRVAQGMVYAHVNKMLKHARKYISPAWFDHSLQANTNLSSNCNAHWDGNTINFYSGSDRCANTGLISDVIYHEWGHGLDANTGGIQDGAFSEGIGDIMSLIMTRSNLLGIGFMVQNGDPVRDLEPDKIYPRDRGEVHAEGLIIASTFWDLFKAVSKKHDADTAVDLLSQYIFKGVYTARKYTELYDAILIIDDDDNNVSNGTPNTCTINKVFADHGLATNLEWCKLASIGDVVVQDEDGDQAIEPGESGEIFLKAFNPGLSALNNLKATVTTTSSDVIIEKNILAWGEIASQKSALSHDSALIAVKESAVCGSHYKLKFHLQADNREVFIEKSFIAGKSLGTSNSFIAQDLPLAIRDYQTTVSKVLVAGDQWTTNPDIFKAHLKFHINHTYIGDLTGTLISPEGKKFEVYKGRGSDDQVTFDADISDLVGNIKGAGEWKLEIYDKASRDQGDLVSFSLDLTPRLFVCD